MDEAIRRAFGIDGPSQGPNITKIKFRFMLDERYNSDRPSGKEWALRVRLNGENWCLKAWEKKPATSTVTSAIELSMRSFEVMYNSLRTVQLPYFHPEIDCERVAESIEGFVYER